MVSKNEKDEADRLVAGADFSITVDTLKDIVNMYMQREHGSDDVDFLYQEGGYDWLARGIKTDVNNGISSSTIEARSRFYGTNEKKQIPPKGFFELAWNTLEDFILRILVIAGVASIIINMVVEADHRTTAWIDGFAILVAVFLVVIVTVLNDMKKEREFQKLNEQAESTKKISVIRDGVEHEDMKLTQVLVGDIVMLKSGMEVAGDGILIEGYTLALDESSMTGETKPMTKDSLEKCLDKKHALEKKGIEKLSHHAIPSIVIMSGTKVLAGSGKMVVVNVGRNSAIGKIQEIMTSGEEELTPLQLKLEKVARDIGYFGLVAAVLIFVILMIRFFVNGARENWRQEKMDYVKYVLNYIIIAITILVVAIPEGLPLAVTLSLALSVGKMMKDNNLVRKLQACETMGSANIICSDKTGTLTRNEMYLTHFWNSKERIVFEATTNKAVPYETFAHRDAIDLFLNTIVLNSVEDPNKKDGNPTEMAILKYLNYCEFGVVDYRTQFHKHFQATFSSDRKRMSTVIKTKEGKGYIFIKGASEYMLEISDKMIDLESNSIVMKNAQLEADINSAIENMATQALRTIGLAYKEVNVDNIDIENADDRGIFEWEKDGFTLVGICGIKDIIRAEVPDSVNKCHIAGIDVKMVTGDNKITARAIAREVNIITDANEATAIVMEGPEFLRLIGGIVCDNCRDKETCTCVNNEKDLDEPANKGRKIRKDTIKNQEEFDKIWRNLSVLARSRPEDKYALVIGLKERDNVVAVTGDGTNDAPALSKANVGFAMNIAGTEVAKQAAAILVMDDNFASIVQAVKWGRNILDCIRKFLQFQLTVNIVAVCTTFISAVITFNPILSAVQLLWLNLIMDTLGALALSTEPPSEELLTRKPVAKNAYIVTPIMMKHIIGQALFQITVMLIFFFLGPYFLFEVIRTSQRQNPDTKLVVSGRTDLGYIRDDYDNNFSTHFTYNFNVFICMQMFNFVNARILDDRINVFHNITNSTYFLWVWWVILILQIFFVSVVGPGVQVIQWGLDPVSWIFCLAVGSISLLVSIILKFIPLERVLPGGGSKEIKISDLNKASSLSIRKGHSLSFYKQQTGLVKRTSVIEDRNLH